MQITAVPHSIQPKHRPILISFSTSELCGKDERGKSTSFNSKGRSREFLGTFSGEKVPAVARHEGRQACAEKALVAGFPFNKISN
jgi:hypothetical protein